MEDEPLIYRVGMFFYVMGGGIFLLFVVSDIAKQAEFDYLFLSVLLMSIGAYFRRGMAPPPSAGRFAGFRKWRENWKNRKQPKQQKQDAKKK
ncbi:MAG: hypothetical protein HYZ24_16415 [Chloroflexi bacterium]|nr:hypothetical protein [Chloroflexota bacterium]